MKLNKVLLTLGVIVFSSIGFSYGYYTAYIDTENSLSSNYPNSTFSPDSDGNFNMSVDLDTKNVFYLKYSGGSWLTLNVMYFYYDDDNLNFWAKYRSNYFTGVVNKFKISSASDIPNLDRFDWFDGTGTWEDVKNSGIGGHISSILYYPSSSTSVAGGNFCFVSDDLNLSVCTSCTHSTNFAYCSSGYSQGDLTTDDYSFSFPYLDNNLLKLSSLVDYSGDSPDYPPVEYISTYGQFFINKGDAYQLYETLGYSKGICYGNFSTGSIVESGSYNYFLSYLLPTECDDSEDYCGGSFFDFYNMQSGLSLQSFFNRYYYTSKSIFEHPDNVSLLSSLIGYPKGMWYIMYKIFYFYDELYIPFSSADYLAYCDMAVNGFDPSDTFDVPHSLGFENFIQEVMDAYLGQDIDYGSGDYVGTGMVAVSLNSSTGSLSDWFSRLKYTVLNNRFIFSSHDGILPAYIGIAFILMLLYYGFKR